MKIVLAFDVYGTLIDTGGVVVKLRELVGPMAEDFSRTWREKQLEYSFRRGLMRQYEDFARCTRDALEYTATRFNVVLTQSSKDVLLGTYRVLPAFADVTTSLDALRDDGFSMYAFSNGSADAVQTLLTAADIGDYFVDVISVDELKTFKPNPDVYRHFLSRAGVDNNQAWLISSNAFDVIGAVSAGMHAAWVKRTADSIFDPWGIEPTVEVTGLHEIGERIAEHYASD